MIIQKATAKRLTEVTGEEKGKGTSVQGRHALCIGTQMAPDDRRAHKRGGLRPPSPPKHLLTLNTVLIQIPTGLVF